MTTARVTGCAAVVLFQACGSFEATVSGTLEGDAQGQIRSGEVSLLNTQTQGRNLGSFLLVLDPRDVSLSGPGGAEAIGAGR